MVTVASMIEKETDGSDQAKIASVIYNRLDNPTSETAGYLNIDATILCQRPKLAPHIPAMRANLAAAFDLPVDAVSVKATTEEHLGFTGEGLGIAAHAVALIETR